MDGLRISALFQVTDFDHGGASEEDVTDDQVGSPERLECYERSFKVFYIRTSRT